MLTKFSGVNYKAFENFELPLKPITVLLGANSCGKSALINALLMFSQTAETSSISESALRLNANKVGMGESLNIIKDKIPKNVLKFRFELDDTDLVRREIFNIKREFVEFYFICIRVMGQYFRSTKTPNTQALNTLDLLESKYMLHDSYNLAQLREISNSLCVLIDIYKGDKDRLDAKKSRPITEKIHNFLENTTKEAIHNSLIHLASLGARKITPKNVEYSFVYNHKEDRLKIIECSFHNFSSECFIKVGVAKGKFFVKSDVIKRSALNHSKTQIEKIINFDSISLLNRNSNMPMFIERYVLSPDPFTTLLERIINDLTKKFINELSGVKINHVSPLRAFPQRYYLLDKSIHHTQLNALDGTELAEVLKKNPEIKNKINLLLAKFNLAVDVEKVNDIIHKINITQDKINLELTDVGFGISQVLPILVQAYLSPKESITIIEQPEIHLHPNMQAWLTDALINIALEEGKKFLIETHSDALVRRIRLRIVDENSLLTSHDVNICNLERNNERSSTTLTNLLIQDDGDVIWPAGFLDVEIDDAVKIQKFKVQRNLKNAKGGE